MQRCLRDGDGQVIVAGRSGRIDKKSSGPVQKSVWRLKAKTRRRRPDGDSRSYRTEKTRVSDFSVDFVKRRCQYFLIIFLNIIIFYIFYTCSKLKLY